MQDEYWVKTFKQVEYEMKKLLDKYKEYIIGQNKHFISLHIINARMMEIDNNYIESNGFKDIIKITS